MQEKIRILDKSYQSLLSKLTVCTSKPQEQPITIPDTSPSVHHQLCSSPKQHISEAEVQVVPPPSKLCSTPKHISEAEVKVVPPPSKLTAVQSQSQILRDPEDIIRMNPKLLSLSNIGRLTVKLGREAYFGQELMTKCTAYGYKDLPALPKDRLLQLKHKLLSLHPQFLNSPVEFESYWKTAMDSLNHAMAKNRTKCTINLSS